MKKYYIPPILVLAVIILVVVAFPSQQQDNVSCNNCNVIIVTSEAIRPDHLGIYGYQRNTTPNIDSFFRKGFVFENDFAQAPNTLPSHMTILTGLYPSHHKVIDVNSNNSLSNEYYTLPEILKLYDYKTAGFHSSNPHMNPKFGFSRGFDIYKRIGVVYHDDVLDFINSSENSKFFIYIQSTNVVDPYVAPHPYDTMFDNNYTGKIVGNSDEFEALMRKNNLTWQTSDFDKVRLLYWNLVNKSDPRDIRHLEVLYDANIYWTDLFFGRIINSLEELGILNHTIVIFGAGHGEEFGEHGGFLHEKLYDETIHVPLLIYVPGARPKIIENQVGNVDIMPTILSILNIPQPENIDGRSLKFLMENPNANDPNQILYSEFVSQMAVRTPEWKMIESLNNSVVSYELYNLKKNPQEKINLIDKNLTQENELKSDLQNYEVKFNSTFTDLKLINSTFIGYP